MSDAATLAVCLVGVGPRGLSVLERLCAHERKSPSCGSLVVHVVDPAEPGAGSVWRTDQSRHLLMNTVASQITVFTDDRVTIDGPIEPGPSLYEWARGLVDPAAPGDGPPPCEPPENGGRPEPGAGIAHGAGSVDGAGSAHGAGSGPGERSGSGERPDAGDGSAAVDAPPGDLTGTRAGEAAEDLAEAARLTPDSYPTRAFYGRYLRACFGRITRGAPSHVEIVTHRTRAVRIADALGRTDGPQSVQLHDGTWLHDVAAVVLAQGHVPARPTPRELRTATLARAHGLTYITPANPADVDLRAIEPAETVLLRGLGLNFFDHMTLLTAGRGGTFRRDGEHLVYLPSGREPRLFATSRRAVPYHARGENQKGRYGRYVPRLLTADYIASLRDRSPDQPPVRFMTHLWPLISKEVQSVYYQALLLADGREAAGRELGGRFLRATGERAEDELPAAYGIEPERRWSWERLLKPYGERKFADREEFRAWLLGYLHRDVREAKAGNVDGPLKAALDVLRDLRNEVRLAVDHGGLDGTSYRDDLDGWYTPMNAFLSIGPPASRIEEMIALIEARVLVVTGPGTEVRIDPLRPAFVAASRVPGPPIRASAMIEARLQEPDLRRTADPLLRYLLATEQCAPYRIPSGGGPGYESGGLAVTERPYRIIDAHGRPHPRRFAYGVPTEAVHWVTAAGIRPGVDSVTLGDSEAIACAVLALAPAKPRRRRTDGADEADGPATGAGRTGDPDTIAARAGGSGQFGGREGASELTGTGRAGGSGGVGERAGGSGQFGGREGVSESSGTGWAGGSGGVGEPAGPRGFHRGATAAELGEPAPAARPVAGPLRSGAAAVGALSGAAIEPAAAGNPDALYDVAVEPAAAPDGTPAGAEGGPAVPGGRVAGGGVDLRGSGGGPGWGGALDGGPGRAAAGATGDPEAFGVRSESAGALGGEPNHAATGDPEAPGGAAPGAEGEPEGVGVRPAAGDSYLPLTGVIV
jgi:hypothetical protein